MATLAWPRQTSVAQTAAAQHSAQRYCSKRLTPATAVCRLAWIHNRWSATGLTFSDSIVIWWAGMMRGAVSVAMVYYRFDPNNTSADEHSATIVVTTLQVVLYSTVGLGGVTGPLLQVLLPRQVRRSPARDFADVAATPRVRPFKRPPIFSLCTVTSWFARG